MISKAFPIFHALWEGSVSHFFYTWQLGSKDDSSWNDSFLVKCYSEVFWPGTSWLWDEVLVWTKHLTGTIFQVRGLANRKREHTCRWVNRPLRKAENCPLKQDQHFKWCLKQNKYPFWKFTPLIIQDLGVCIYMWEKKSYAERITDVAE